jgi:hydrogenase/urease accessory protein HupE
MTTWRHVVLVLVSVVTIAGSARAHPMDPGLLRLRELRSGVFGVQWRPPSESSRARDLRPVLPSICRTSSEGPLDPSSPFRVVHCGSDGLWGQTVAVDGAWEADDEILVQVSPLQGASTLGVLRATTHRLVVPERATVRQGFVRLGVEHILTGWDHLLFVLGLVLLNGFRRSLLGTITAFTVAHSITLGLAVLELARPPMGVIEALIAFSVLLLAADLSRSDDAHEAPFGRRHPWMFAFAFGLLHGFGFAEALRSMSIPAEDVAGALLAFNIGVEMGQIGVVAALGVGEWALTKTRHSWRTPGRRLMIEAMGALAAFWFCQRVLAVSG